VPGTYDDAVRVAARQAAANGWFTVSDTSWSGYSEVPKQIMQGYRLMADEAATNGGVNGRHMFSSRRALVALRPRSWCRCGRGLIPLRRWSW
jgi:hypothetical protein